MANILLLNGPNLNLLGSREPEIYGATTLADIENQMREQAQQLKHELTHLQSNAEHQLVDAIQNAKHDQIDLIIINPGAFTHTSVALRDALLAVAIPFIEIHISNVFAREQFRHKSYLTDIAIGIISGFGTNSYQLALQAANHYLQNQ